MLHPAAVYTMDILCIFIHKDETCAADACLALHNILLGSAFENVSALNSTVLEHPSTVVETSRKIARCFFFVATLCNLVNASTFLN